MKQLTIFGASGKTGREVVALALERGYRVVAFVHSRDPFEPNDSLKVVKGDIKDRSAVVAAIAGSEVVISVLGSWGTGEKNIVSTGMQAIIPVMEQTRVKRLITLTGAGSMWSGDRPNFIDRLAHILLGVVAPKILRDGEEHLRLLDASKVEWTGMRSPVMRSRGKTDYRLSLRPPAQWATVPRPAVATGLVDQVESREFLRSAPFIHRS